MACYNATQNQKGKKKCFAAELRWTNSQDQSKIDLRNEKSGNINYAQSAFLILVQCSAHHSCLSPHYSHNTLCIYLAKFTAFMSY